MPTTCYIYTLHASNDPTCRPRYVGFTTNPKLRELDHNCKKGKGRKYQWVESVRATGARVVLRVVFSFISDDLTERKAVEASWIAQHTEKFPDLLNDGGLGQGVLKTSSWLQGKLQARYADPSYRAKLSASKKQACNTPEFRAKMKEVAQARLTDPEHRAKHKTALQRVNNTLEMRAKRKELAKKQWESPEHRAKFLATRARMTLERRLNAY